MVNMLAISALESLKQEDQEPEASLGYAGTFFFFLNPRWILAKNDS